MYRWLALCLTLVLTACSSEVSVDNPYDPEAPPGLQVKSLITGVVSAEAAFDPATLVMTVEGLTPRGSPVRDAVIEIDDTTTPLSFSTLIPAGTYLIRAEIPGFRSDERTGILVATGEDQDIGELFLTAGRGSLAGRVVIASPGGPLPAPQDTEVTLLRLTSPITTPTDTSCTQLAAEESVRARLNADGTFVERNLAVGPFVVIATLDGYLPAVVGQSVEVQVDQVTDVGSLELTDGGSILTLSAPTNPDADPSGIATNSTTITANVIPPPIYNGMQLSLMPDFGDVIDWTTPAAATPFDLSGASDGEQQVFLRFRAPTCDVSPTFAAAIILDTTPPVAEGPVPANGATCANDPQITLDLPGEDPCGAGSCAGLYQMRIVADGTLDTEIFVDYLPQEIVTFPGDGSHDVQLELRDAAGNTSAPATGSILVNTLGPQPGGQVVTIDDNSGTVRSLSVLLTLDVTGATEVELGNAAGLDGSGWMALPASRQLTWQLLAGTDGLRTVVARFRDDCGNVTQEYPQDILLDRSGMITGSARLEGGTDHSGTVISFWLWDATAAGGAGDYVDTTLTATTGATGSFSLSGLTTGDYRLVFSAAGFAQRTMDGILLTEGGIRTLGEILLLLARGDLEGSATLLGEGSHEGILVQAAPGITTSTDSAGNYLFTDLPIGDYFVSATVDDAFQGAAAPTPATLLEGQLVTAPALVLQPVPGIIDGVVQRSGQTDHTGIDVLLEGVTVGDTKVQDSTVTDALGNYSFLGLTAGQYRLIFQTPQYVSDTAEGIVLTPAETVTVPAVILPQATGSLRATVDVVDRSDDSGVLVTLEKNLSTIRIAASITDGTVDFADVPADSYTLVATLNGYGVRRVTPVVVTADTLTDLTSTPILLTPQIGDAYLQTPADVILAGATNLTSIQVRGSFPSITDVRICESPTIQASDDPSLFTLGNCAWLPVAYTRAEPDFDPLPLTFSPSACPDPGDPAAICDGQKTVWIRMRDSGGLLSDWFPRPVILDTVPPLGNVVIEATAGTLSGGLVVGDGEAYTDSITVSVLLSAHEDLSGVAAGDAVSGVVSGRVFRDPTDANPVLVGLSEGNTTLQGVTLASGLDGDRSLYLEVADAAGNVSVTNLSTVICPPARTPSLPTDCDAIFLDRTPPPALAFSIEPTSPGTDMTLGADWTNTTTVTLGIDSTTTSLPEDYAVEAILANDSGFVASLAMPLANPLSLVGWNLTVGDGPKTVYIRIRDAAGNLSTTFSDSIGLDTQAPQIPVLDIVPPVTPDASPSLSFSGGTGATRHFLQLSDSPSFDTTGPTTLFLEVELTDLDYTAVDDAAGAAAYPLADGIYWWRVQAADDADLRSPYTPAQRFEVDTLPPPATALDPVAASTGNMTADTTPTLTWAAAAGTQLYRVQVSSFADFSAGLQVDQSTAQLSLTTSSLGEGLWYARVQTIDAAGNAADPLGYSNVITFEVDTTSPADALISSPADGGTWSVHPVAFVWAAVSDAASYRLEIATNAAFSSATVEAGLTTTARSLVLDEGSYWVRVITTDLAGNRSLGTTVVTFTLDTVAPDVPTLNRLPNLVSTRQPVLSWSDESASGAIDYLVQIDGLDRTVSGTTSYPVPLAEALADGVHTWTVAARDSAGNLSNYATVQSFSVDDTDPAAPSLIPVSPDPSAITQPTFAFAAVGDAVQYEVEWHDNNLFTAGVGGTTTITGTSTLPSPALGVGTWYWHVRAEDASGNVGGWSSIDDFVVDTVAPTDPTLLTPADASSLTSTSVSFTWSSVADAVSYQLEVATDVGFTTPQVEPGLTATSRSLVLGDGSWWARVRALDAAGNLSGGAAVNTFVVDATAPDVPVATAIASPTTDSTPTLGWSDESGSGAVSYRIDIDGTVVTVTVPTVSYTPGTALADGPHSFAVAAVDAAGNQSAYSSAQVFEVDATDPAIPVPTPVTPDPRNTQNATLTWSAVSDAVSYTVEWDSDSGFLNGAGGTSTVATPSLAVGPLAEGPWYWRVFATDDASNQSANSASDLFTVDLTAPANPTPTAPADASFATASTVTFGWSSVVDATAYLFDRSAAPTFATYDRTEVAGTGLSASLPDGVWYWRVLARDAAGNISSAAAATVRSLEVDTAAPGTPVLSSVTSPTADTTPALTWSAVATAASYLVTLDGVPTTVTAPTVTTTPTALLDGTHTWTVAAQDAAGNVGTAAPTEAFVVDNTAPATPTPVAYTPDPTTDNTPTVQWSTVTGATSYRITWSDDGFTTSASATTSDVSLAIGPLTGSPATTWAWRVESLDDLGNASAPSIADSFLVDTVTPAAPSLIAPADTSTALTATVAFSWSAVAGASSYRLQVGSDASLTTIVHDLAGITGTAQSLTLTDATWYWRVLSTDAAGNQTAPGAATIWSVEVDANAPATPTLSVIVTPTNDGTPTFVWSDESSSGAVDYLLRIDAGDTTVAAATYTPSSNLAEGSHTVSVAARDSAGNTSAYSASQSVMIDLSAPSLPASPLPADGSADTDGSIAFSWTASTDTYTAVSYRLQVSSASDFLSLLVNDNPATNGATVLLADGDYVWRLRAEDAAGNVSAWVSASTGQSLTVDTTAPAAPDVIPVGSAVTSSPTLRWFSQAASGAISYDVQVDDDSGFATPDLSGSTGTTAFATGLVDGTWYWRVRSVDTHGNQSIWSATDSFALDSTAPGPPTSPTPVAATASNSAAITFAWVAPAGGAASYRVEIAYDSSFAAIAWDAETTTPTTTVTISFPDGSYFWRVLALDAVGNQSTPAPGATGSSFSVDTTPPDRPTVTTTPGWIGGAATDYVLGWTDESDSGASTYEYQVSSASTFATLEQSGSTASTSVTIASIPADGTWYWRVRALDTLGNPTSASAGWTAAVSFGVDTIDPTAPGFVAPPDDPNPGYIIAISTVTPEWTTSTDTNLSHYQLQISQASDFSNQVVVDTTINPATLSNQTLGDGVYYWRVRAVDLAGNVSEDWSVSSTSRSFTVDTTQPSATSLSPLSSPTADSRPDLAWSAVSDAELYRIEWDDDPTFGSVDVTITNAQNPAPRAYLQDSDYASNLSDGIWYARVTVQDAAGHDSAPSAALELTIDSIPPSAPASCGLTTLTSYANALSDPTPEWVWEAVSDAATYELEIERWVAGSFQPDSTVTGIEGTGTFDVVFALPSSAALTDGDLYRFSVEAIDSAGNVSAPVFCETDGVGGNSLRSDQSGPVSGVSGLSFIGANPTNGASTAVQWTAEEDLTNSGEYGYDIILLAQDQVTVLDSAQVVWTSPFFAGTHLENFTIGLDGTYYAQVVSWDAAGNQSPKSTTVVPLVVDTSAPTGTITITDAEPTNAAILSLALSYSTDTVGMKVEESGSIICAGGIYEAVSTTKSIAIAGTGPVKISVCFRDAAGNTWVATDEILVDRTGPTGSLLIFAEGNTGYSISRAVQLDITTSDTDIDKMAVKQADSITCSSAVYEPYTPFKSLTLTGLDGTKNIQACLKDTAGNTTELTQASVFLDLSDPWGDLVIEDGLRTDYAWTRNINLDITAAADVDSYFIVNEQTPDCGDQTATWLAGTPAANIPWVLGGGDQQINTVALCFQDAAGNTALATDFIILDLQPPSGFLWINQDAQYTTDPAVTLTVDVPSGAFEMAFSETAPSPDCAGDGSLTWVGFGGESPFNLTATEGTKTVYACFRDEAQRTAQTSDTIELDLTDPFFTATSLQGRTGIDCMVTTFSPPDCNANNCSCNPGLTRFTMVVVDVESPNATEWTFEIGNVDCSSVVGWNLYVAANFPQNVSMDGIDGAQSVTVCIRDASGRTAKWSAGLTVDMTPPEPPTDVSVVAGNRGVQVDWIGSVTDTDVDHYEVHWQQPITAMVGTETVAAALETYTLHPTLPELANCTEVEVQLLAVDSVGNVGWSPQQFVTPVFPPVDLAEDAVRASFRRLEIDWGAMPAASMYRAYYKNVGAASFGADDYAEVPGTNTIIEDGELLQGRPATLGNLQEAISYAVGVQARDSVTQNDWGIDCWSAFGAAASDTTFGLELFRHSIGKVNNGRFGDLLAGGDLDRDGYSEIVLGSPTAPRGLLQEGLITVLDGRTGRRIIHDTGPAQGSLLSPNWGQGIAVLRDNDLDGFPELMTGGQGGAVYAWSGRDRSLAWIDVNAGNDAGYSIAEAGLSTDAAWHLNYPVDVYPEHAVGDPTGGGFGLGVVRFYSGNNPLPFISSTFSGLANDRLGEHLSSSVPLAASTASVMTAVGTGDFATRWGRVVVINTQTGAEIGANSIVGADANTQITGPAPITPPVTGTPDYNWLAVPRANGNQVQVWQVSATGVNLFQTINAPTGLPAGTRFGQSVEWFDLDADSKPDLLVGAPSTASDGSGSFWGFDVETGRVLLRQEAPQGTLGFGWSLLVSDVLNDGIPDIVVGAPQTVNAGGFSVGWVGIYQLTDLSVSPWDVRSTALSETTFSVSGGTPPYTFDLPLKGTLEAGQPEPSIDASGNYRAGTGVGTDLLQVTDARGRVRFVQIPLLAELEGGTERNTNGPDDGGQFGSAFAPTEDRDGDGRRELLVGAPQGQGGGGNVGVVHLVDGATGGILGSLANPNNFADDEFGAAVAGIIDLNGDGRGEILVGAPGWDLGINTNEGRVYLLDGDTFAVLSTFEGVDPDDRFGSPIIFLGQWNGEFDADLAVAAPNGNYVRVLEATSGAAPQLVNAPCRGSAVCRLDLPGTVPEAGVPEQFGLTLTQGDVTGDLLPELIIGAPGQDTFDGLIDAGRLIVYAGGWSQQSAGNVILDRRGDRDGMIFGGSATVIGDFDDDGKRDILVGAGADSSAGLDGAGSVTVISSYTGAILYRKSGTQTGGQFGFQVAASDLDRDGFTDWVVGTPFAGSNGIVMVIDGETLRGRSLVTGFSGWPVGNRVVTGYDANGDGYDDLVYGMPTWDNFGGPLSPDGRLVAHITAAP